MHVVSRILSVLLFSLLFSELQALELQGVSTYSRLNNDVYLAAVFSDQRDSSLWLSQSSPLRLDMIIKTQSLSPRRFYRLWNEALAINLSEAEMNERAEQVTAFMRMLQDDLVAGDRVSVTNETGETVVTVNGVELRRFNDPTLVNALLAGWIGKYPRTPTFKQALTQMPDSQRSMYQAELELMIPAEERVAAIKAWLEPVAAPIPAQQKVAAAVLPTVSEQVAAAVLPTVSEQVASGTAAKVAAADSAGEANAPASGAAVTRQPSEEPSEPGAPGDVDADGQDSLEKADVVKGLLAEGSAATASGNADADDAVESLTAAALEQERLLEQQEVQEQQRLAAEAERQRILELQIAQQRAEIGYYRALLRKANGSVVYPKQALRRGIQGTVNVMVMLDRNGGVIGADVSSPSGHDVLDRSALKAAREAAPYSSIPAILEGDQFEFDIPFRFVMNTH